MMMMMMMMMDKDGARINSKNNDGTRDDVDGKEEAPKRQKVAVEAVQNKEQKATRRTVPMKRIIVQGMKTRGGKTVQ